MDHKRRAIAAIAAFAAMPWPVAAQVAKASYRIGWLASIDSFNEPYSRAFLERLAQRGFVEGKNLSIARRHGGGELEKQPALAVELTKLSPDLLFSAGPEANLVALKQAGGAIPIVFVAVDFDPIATGHIPNAARPDGRITGLTAVQSVLPGKRVELMRELLPEARKLAVFANAQTEGQLVVAREAAARLGIALHVIQFKRPPFDYEAAFTEAVRERADGLLVLGSALFVPARRKIADLALRAKLPSSFHHAQWAEVGGLMSYGFNFPQMWRSAADMVAKILRGARPSDVPVEQPANYELAINARTAKALGVKIPESIRLRVDRVIQ
jgi:putative tryptophan/tyrosine transport system substrate-binding protein